MFAPIILFAIAGCISLLGTLLIKWLSNRPLDHKEYSPDEIIEELESAFVERSTAEVITTIEYLPMVFEKVSASIDTGFPDSQIAALIHRISTQKTYRVRSAVFPISINSVASDFDVQWVRPSEDKVQMRIEAVPELIRAIEQIGEVLPATAVANTGAP